MATSGIQDLWRESRESRESMEFGGVGLDSMDVDAFLRAGSALQDAEKAASPSLGPDTEVSMAAFTV